MKFDFLYILLSLIVRGSLKATKLLGVLIGFSLLSLIFLPLTPSHLALNQIDASMIIPERQSININCTLYVGIIQQQQH